MTPDRRTFLTTGLGVTAALTTPTNGLMTPAQSHAGETLSLGGDLNLDPNVRAAAAQDFGHLVYKEPRAVFRPSTRSGIASLVRYAKLHGLKVAARGQGHSIYGRALAGDGIVIDMGTVNTIYPVEPDRIVVEAGATWASLLKATLAKGLTPPVLTNYLGLSVGGTIAVGGIGATSSRHGMQTDQIIELDVVTGDGIELTCSATLNPDLFNGTRAGLGQCGIITRATLRLIRAPDRVRRYQLLYRDLASLTSDQRRALKEQRFDQLQGALLPDGDGGWRYQLDTAVFYDRDAAPDDKAVLSKFSDDRKMAVINDQTYHDDAFAFSKFETLLRSKGQWFNAQPWLLTFLPGSNAEEVAREIVARLTTNDIGPFGRITYYPLLTSAFRTPLVRLPDDSAVSEGVVFPFNIIRIPTSNDAATLELMVAQNRLLYDLIRKAGGVQYPVGAFPMSVNDWQNHFGSSLPLLSAAKRRHDPGNSLTPGYNVF